MYMGKLLFKPNARTTIVQEELSKFLDFCRDYGYRYNESDLYNFKSYAYQQYNKYTTGKNAKNMWTEDARRLGRPI